MSMELPSARSGSNLMACEDVVSTRTVCALAIPTGSPLSAITKRIPHVQPSGGEDKTLHLMEISPLANTVGATVRYCAAQLKSKCNPEPPELYPSARLPGRLVLACERDQASGGRFLLDGREVARSESHPGRSEYPLAAGAAQRHNAGATFIGQPR